MAINKKSLLDQFLSSQHRRYLSFFNFNEQQLDLLNHHLTSKLSTSKSIKLKLVKTDLQDKEVIAA